MGTDGTLTSLYSFGGDDGKNPEAELALGTNGCFFGTTAFGGANRNGTVFTITTNGVFASLHSFADQVDGKLPSAALLLGPNGTFYGTTSVGGNGYDAGTVFTMTSDGTVTPMFLFSQTNGYLPDGVLALGPDGNFYGTTSNGTTNFNDNLGSIFSITPGGTFTNLYFFTGGDDGNSPYAGMVLGPDGAFYGTAQAGGLYGYGTVFKITTDGTFTPIYSFGQVEDEYGNSLDGANPYCRLVLGPDGAFYGTTFNGGANGDGTVFKITTDGTLTTLYLVWPDSG